MFRGKLLLKNKSRKRSKKQNKNKSKKRKTQREENNFKRTIQLLSADTSVTIISEVNVESLLTLNANQIKWLRRMVDQGQVTKTAVATIKDCVKGFMETVDEATDEASDEAVESFEDSE